MLIIYKYIIYYNKYTRDKGRRISIISSKINMMMDRYNYDHMDIMLYIYSHYSIESFCMEKN